jgi:hypothetical protein
MSKIFGVTLVGAVHVDRTTDLVLGLFITRIYQVTWGVRIKPFPNGLMRIVIWWVRVNQSISNVVFRLNTSASPKPTQTYTKQPRSSMRQIKFLQHPLHNSPRCHLLRSSGGIIFKGRSQWWITSWLWPGDDRVQWPNPSTSAWSAVQQHLFGKELRPLVFHKRDTVRSMNSSFVYRPP